MKKLLLASTALLASATFANAQGLTITGEGRMGIQAFYNGTSWSWTQEQRLRLDFSVAVEADHGLTFGAWSRAEMNSAWPGVSNAGGFSPARVWVEANGLRLTFGNSDGALASYGYSHGWLGGCMVGYEGGQLCGDTAGLLVAGTHLQTDVAVAHPAQVMLSYEGENFAVAVSDQRGGSTEIGGNATFGAFSVGAGYNDTFDVATVSGHYDGGSWGVGALVAWNSTQTNWALSGTVALGGGELYGYVGEVFSDGTYGLSYSYGLGGGANLVIGGEHIGGVTDNTSASVGVVFTF